MHFRSLNKHSWFSINRARLKLNLVERNEKYAPAWAATLSPAHLLLGASFVALRSKSAKTLNVSGDPESFSISEQTPAMSTLLA